LSSIYFHIPFCKKRCTYCDFFSTVLGGATLDRYIESMGEELKQRKDYLDGQPLDTIYFGGGTPSQLSAAQFRQLFAFIYEAGFVWKPDAEITFEANPDDLSADYLASLADLPFNRISIGIQSFNDSELVFLNRRHTAASAGRAVELVQQYGYENISIDLMYGLPNQTLANWEETIAQAIALNVPHISAYHLIYEEGTPMYNSLSEGRIMPVEEELSLRMFEVLIDQLAAAGYEHYEISNFARPGYRSRHNASYWNGGHYLGIGAAAHSYNGTSRHRNNPSIKNKQIVYQPEIEPLDDKTRYNDYILTRLRTKEGINLEELSALFGEEAKDYCLRQADRHLSHHTLYVKDNRLQLTREGIFISDGIMSDLIQ